MFSIVLLSVISITCITISACFESFRARSMPSASISLDVFLMPAVSLSRTGIPDKTILTDIISRVVPAIEETIAASLFKIAFKIVDFPELGRPIITISRPCLMASPASAVLRIYSVPSNTRLRYGSALLERLSGTSSSSGKSISPSI